MTRFSSNLSFMCSAFGSLPSRSLPNLAIYHLFSLDSKSLRSFISSDLGFRANNERDRAIGTFVHC